MLGILKGRGRGNQGAWEEAPPSGKWRDCWRKKWKGFFAKGRVRNRDDYETDCPGDQPRWNLRGGKHLSHLHKAVKTEGQVFQHIDIWDQTFALVPRRASIAIPVPLRVSPPLMD